MMMNNKSLRLLLQRQRQRSLSSSSSSSVSDESSSKEAIFHPTETENVKRGAIGGTMTTFDLGNGSEVVHLPRFLPRDRAWDWFHYMDKHIPWSRPTLTIYGRPLLQPRDSCYIASEGLPQLSYSGHKPHAYSWDDFPPLKDILHEVHRALPGSRFNSLVLNRYKGGNDYVSWHSDEETAYGLTPEIASVTFGCEREFLLKKKPSRKARGPRDETTRKRLRTSTSKDDQLSFTLKHGSLLVMRGYTQRDWLHSVPKRARAMSTRINLTFRCILQ
ncbi:DNA oxidative demethylase ALKBH2-like isoform X1 [Punica granatum]|uniref:DNA oxidative demethylase ALKBH2-like isoform X1 n=3 Tax=Punica granatum TaxID=22663 RepID=A0A6P8DL12_PUNGR|nr:DNA oxidative demethylase ALKBH2-like isoform X1 [Punica granatum]